ncbi:MAG: hypothetical protein AAF532_04900 [Planctomycetota bacterium]
MPILNRADVENGNPGSLTRPPQASDHGCATRKPVAAKAVCLTLLVAGLSGCTSTHPVVTAAGRAGDRLERWAVGLKKPFAGPPAVPVATLSGDDGPVSHEDSADLSVLPSAVSTGPIELAGYTEAIDEVDAGPLPVDAGDTARRPFWGRFSWLSPRQAVPAPESLPRTDLPVSTAAVPPMLLRADSEAQDAEPLPAEAADDSRPVGRF